ncbi:MAG: hypothetical protein OIF56_11035 [Cohaesibacter sp.]|nr:hypothetical protein [Cohaesibacter sp.]MCV6603094.1 hypothetical protein [Cohaesibacter sp.]
MEASSLITLFVLTAMASGGHSTAYTTKPDMQTCKASIAPVTEILTNGGVTVLAIECVTMKQRVTQFQHRPPKDAPRTAYLNRLVRGDLTLIEQESESACKANHPQKAQGDIRQFCATSKQSLQK